MGKKNSFNIDYIDRNLEEEGVWVPYTTIEGAEIKIARLSSKPVQRHFIQLSKKNRKAAGDEELMEALMMELFAKHVIKGWKGIKNFGKEYKYTAAHAAILLEEVVDFAQFVSERSQDMSLFKRDHIADIAEVATAVKKKSRGKSSTARKSKT